MERERLFVRFDVQPDTAACLTTVFQKGFMPCTLGHDLTSGRSATEMQVSIERYRDTDAIVLFELADLNGNVSQTYYSIRGQHTQLTRLFSADQF